MQTFADKSDTSRVVICANCGRPNKLPLTASAANCGECKEALEISAAKSAQLPAAEPVSPDLVSPNILSVTSDADRSMADPEPSHASSPRPRHRDITAEEIKTGNTGYGWVIAAITGAIVISTFRNSADGVRLIAPCLVMLVYFGWGWQQDSRNKEKLADSLYFLGFIWTLYALIDALISGAGQAKDAAALFTTFGYALVTTGLGMFLRMVVIQLAYSAPEQIEDTRDAVAKGLEQFRVNLQEAQNALVASRNQFTKTSEAWVAVSKDVSTAMRNASMETSEGARAAVERVVSGLQEVTAAVESCGESSKMASRAVSSVAKRVTASGEKLTETFDQSTSLVAAGLTTAANRLAQIPIPENLVANRLNGFVEEMVAPSKALLTTMNGMSMSAALAQQRVSTAAAATSQGMAGVAENLERLSASVKVIEQSIDKLSSSLSAIAAQSDGLSRSTGQLVDAQTALATRMQAAQSTLRVTPPQPPQATPVGDARRWPWSR